jgi:hypothetical protein
MEKRKFFAVEIPAGTTPDMCEGCPAKSDPRCSGVTERLEKPMTVAVSERKNFELRLGDAISRWVLKVGACHPRDAGSAVPEDEIDAFAPKA